MKWIRFWSRKLYRRAVQEVASRFYINPEADPRKSILIAGTARSGTTWLGDMIASQIPSRILFEPFNPDLVPEYRNFRYFQYMRPGTKNPEFNAFARKIFTGEIGNRWIDHQNERIVSEYRIIKEIRANLALSWLHDNFPEVPIIFLIRHPCAVVASRMELNWATDRDIEPLLAQPDLMEDHLASFMDTIRNAETLEEKHAIIWSVSHLVPLKQFHPSRIKTVHYENLCVKPETELQSIFETIGQPSRHVNNASVSRPSQTSRASSAIVDGTDKVSAWQKKLSERQINNILRIVSAFGLDHLYGDSLLPLNKNAT